MRQSFATLFFVLATIVVADPLDDAIAMMKRQNDNSTTSATESLSSSIADVTSTFTPSPTVSTVTSFSTFTPATSEDAGNTSEDNSPTSAEQESSTRQTSRTQITTSATQEIITTFTTESDGSTVIGTRTSSTVVATTTDVDPATLNEGDNNGGSSGLSDKSKATIGGVVGGVGGALLLGALAYTAWRIFAKKKNLHDDDLYDPNTQQEKLSTSTDNTPFRNNVEQYHQPGPVNTASNF